MEKFVKLKKLKRKRKHGFLKRTKKHSSKKIIKRRIAKRRKKINV